MNARSVISSHHIGGSVLQLLRQRRERVPPIVLALSSDSQVQAGFQLCHSASSVTSCIPRDSAAPLDTY